MITENLLTKKDFTWVDVQEPQDEDFERLNKEFSLPYLLVLDCLRPEHLPKYEESDNGHFLMMRSFDSDSSPYDTTVQDLTRKIAFFITENRLVTIHRVDLDYIEAVSEKIKKNDQMKSMQGLLHNLILAVIRTFEMPLNRLQDEYDDFEQDVLAKKKEHLNTNRIYRFRRQIFILKRILKQSNDALNRFKEFWIDYPSMLQDLRENIDQLYYHLDEVSDNFEHLFELHIALNEQRANEVVKILTIFSTILLPLNFMASYYGMNFTTLPGLQSSKALAFLTFFMVLFLVLTFWYFRHKGWFRTSRE